MQSTGKKLLACSLAAAVMSITGTALAGQEPFVATVGPDSGSADGLFPTGSDRDLDFYISPKLRQFTEHDCTADSFPGESFTAHTGANATGGARVLNQPEICDTAGQTFGGFVFRGDWNARVPGQNSGSYRWKIALPKKPNGPINIVLECGILKPQQFGVDGFEAVKRCAGYTGERVTGCSSLQEPVGSVTPARLPNITARAFSVNLPPLADGTRGFVWLNAYQNPGSYTSTLSLNQSADVVHRRIVLKACQDKTIVAQLPIVEGEQLLEQGDIIEVTLNVPGGTGGNQLDIYCGRDSLKIQGIGEPNC